ncbi:MAG TPA: DsbA family protein [Rubrivivax sp.]|nr:DsbA family protein [Rubrivivax sp.]
MEQACWFFDLISPFSYLHYRRLRVLSDRLDIQPVPVLFAGLLKHWGTKGPAEVPSKRLHTYQYCVWAASREGLPFCMPARHPFNPLPAQRLLIALGASAPVVEAAFDFVYGQGRDPELEFAALAERLGAPDAPSLIAAPEVKQQLIVNTQRAIGRGVFGVPTLAFRDRLFWGSDTVDWAARFLDDPALFDRPEYQAAASPEFGVARS